MIRPFFFLLLLLLTGARHTVSSPDGNSQRDEVVVPGDARFEAYLPMIRDKRVGLVVNHTARVGSVHLLDTLLALGVDVVKIFAPEHGFRGTADAGAHVASGVDESTGIPVISLYGAHRKPRPDDLAGLDILLFDIQDVGVRFYTYISTMSYVMEACAREHIPFVVLDRPNPNGHFVDGPLMDSCCTSFIGLHAGVPVAHGMTVGEYGLMVNEEGWLPGGLKADFRVIPMKNWSHEQIFRLPVRPSPNLPNMKSVYLYPTLCFFEATVLSVGRGTDKPFQIIGHPDFPGDYHFTPKAMPGAQHPKLEDRLCHGIDYSALPEDSLRAMGRIRLDWIIGAWQRFPDKSAFFLPHFYKLAGNKELEEQIKAGLSEEEIRASWAPGLRNFKEMRSKYLIYP